MSTRFAVLESLLSDTRSSKTLARTLMSLQSSLRLHHGGHLTKENGFPRTVEFSIVADPLRHEMQASPTVFHPNGGLRK